MVLFFNSHIWFSFLFSLSSLISTIQCDEQKSVDEERFPGIDSTNDEKALIGEWTTWTTCSKSCDRGFSTRQCLIPNTNTSSQNCKKIRLNMRICNRQPCDKNARALYRDGGWSEWSKCSKPCGGGTKTRECSNPYPKYGGAWCKGMPERSCNLDACTGLFKEEICEDNLCSSKEGCPLVKNTLLTTLPVLNKEFSISFEFRATAWQSGWQNVLHFTEGGNCCNAGARVPAFWVSNSGQLHPCFAVGDNGNYCTLTRQFSLNTWHKVEISQSLEKEKVYEVTKDGRVRVKVSQKSVYMYRVVVDGEDVIAPVENTNPRRFTNVKVFAADNWHNPLQGSIRNLLVNTECGAEWWQKLGDNGFVKECHDGCRGKGGACDFCGDDALCCREGSGECPFGAEEASPEAYTCVTKTVPKKWMQKSNRDCWGPCGARGGDCSSFCGHKGYCCRKGFGGCPVGAADTSPHYHTCVKPAIATWRTHTTETPTTDRQDDWAP